MNPKLSQPLTVAIPASPRSYPIVIESGLLSRTAEWVQRHCPGARQVLIVSDDAVAVLYGGAVQKALETAGLKVHLHRVPVGETSKTLSEAERIFTRAMDAGMSRRDVFLALGGGVMGDLTGFCAATYMRGARFVQAPTTLLAQVDSSVGGKVAVNFDRLKNGIGAFYQPDVVLIDTDVLQTLPAREVKAGLAEVVKYGLIETSCLGHPPEDAGFFAFLETHADNLNAVMPEIIRRACAIKAAVVAQDETDQTGLRALLNLGHTFAHAYEAISGYKTLLHGEAVAIGLIDACRLATSLGMFPQTETDRLIALSGKLGLPQTRPEAWDPAQLLALMRQDKKSHAGAITFVLPSRVMGTSVLCDTVPDEAVLSIFR
ncbi:MAG: 3-dehydroquinate synthase [Candidatus Melainabacteria bacterium]